MKHLSSILSVLALIGVIVLAGLFFSKKEGMKNSSAATPAASTGGTPARIAYIDIDTFEANYTILKNKKEEFKKRQANMEAELQRSANQYQNDLMALQQKAKAGTMSQEEGKAAETRLMQMQQSFQTRKESMELQFVKDQEAFNKDLHEKLDAFLEEYNTQHHYDYILSYSRNNPADHVCRQTSEHYPGCDQRNE